MEMFQTLLGAVPQSVFSPYLAELYACGPEDDKREILLRAYRSEPYLAAKLCNMANSVHYGHPNKIFSGTEACIDRVGQEEAYRTAMAFYVQAGLKGWMQQDERSLAVWQEAVFAANVAQMLSSYGDSTVESGTTFLSTLLSYLGELYLVGPMFNKIPVPLDLGLYAHGTPGQVDAFWLTKSLMQKLGLPMPVKSTILSVEELHYGRGVKEQSSAAILTLARGLAQSFCPDGVFVARIDGPSVDSAQTLLSLKDKDMAAIQKKIGKLREKLPALLT